MKASSPQSDAPELPGARIQALFVLFAGFLLQWLPLLFARGVNAWFSGAPAAWTYTSAAVIVLASLGLITGRWMVLQRTGNAVRWLQVVALLGAVVSLPVLPRSDLVIVAPSNATWELLRLLLLGVGPASFALGLFLGLRLIGPSAGDEGRALVIGALVAQLLFLLVLDPGLTTAEIDAAFSWSLLVFALAAGAWLLLVRSSRGVDVEPRGGGQLGGAMTSLLQVALGGVAVALFLVVTPRPMRETVSVPQLWILPTLVCWVAGAAAVLRPGLRRPSVIATLQIVSSGALVLALFTGLQLRFGVLMTLLLVGLGTGIIACLGAVAFMATADRSGRWIHRVLIGAVLGAVVATYVAQRAATDYTEFQVTVLLAAGLTLVTLARGARRRILVGIGALGVGGLGVILIFGIHARTINITGRVRTFFGATSAMRVNTGKDPYLLMISGDTPRAAQFMLTEAQFEPTLQHSRGTGIGVLFRSLPKGNYRRVGIIGIGNGDLVAYAHPTDVFRFYEFDPGVSRMADRQFGFLPQANFDWDLVPGDPRRVLESAPAERFDVLIVDALTGGSLPAHLLTREAFQVWRKHLEVDGVIAINLTNRRFDLLPVIWRQAIELGLQIVPASTTDNPAAGTAAADWVLLTNNSDLLRKGGFRVPDAKMIEQARQFPLWTDEDSRPLSVVR